MDAVGITFYSGSSGRLLAFEAWQESPLKNSSPSGAESSQPKRLLRNPTLSTFAACYMAAGATPIFSPGRIHIGPTGGIFNE
jgi:hypothetical protein